MKRLKLLKVVEGLGATHLFSAESLRESIGDSERPHIRPEHLGSDSDSVENGDWQTSSIDSRTVAPPMCSRAQARGCARPLDAGSRPPSEEPLNGEAIARREAGTFENVALSLDGS